MKYSFLKIVIAIFTLTAISTSSFAQKKKKKKKKSKTKTEVVTPQFTLKNQLDSVSYAVGLSLGTNIKKDFSEGNLEAIIAGLKSTMADTNFLIKPDQMQAVLAPYFQKKQQAKQQEQQAAQAKKYEDVKQAGIKFLAENKKKPGVITTASGLQYIVLKEGTGKKPTATSNVKVHYHGTTPDGTVFDSSVDRGEPISFALNQVIKGWTEGLQLMKEGAKYKFFIPQELAYGANAPQGGQGPIKPYMPLVFEVELIKINE